MIIFIKEIEGGVRMCGKENIIILLNRMLINKNKTAREYFDDEIKFYILV